MGKGYRQPGVDRIVSLLAMDTSTQRWLIETKFTPPNPSAEQIDRAILYAGKLDADTLRVHIVSAFAGYGKTTFLAQWHTELVKRGVSTAWLSLDEADQQTASFVAYLKEAFRRSGIAEANKANDGGGGRVPPRTLVAQLLSCLDLQEEPFFLFLDDYHRAASREVDEFVGILIEYAPPRLKFVIASRTLPKLKQGKLRANEDVGEITTDDLKFGIDEILQIFAGHLAEDQAAELQRQTEGWPLACKMASYLFGKGKISADQLGNLSASNRDLSHYISDEIFNDLPQDEQRFLLVTSVAERFSRALAGHLDGDMQSWEILEALEREKTLVFPLDDTNDWFRCHQLFRDYLYERLKRSPKDDYRELHRAASEWLFDHGHMQEAVEQAIQADDIELAAREIERAGGWRLAFEGQLNFLRTFLDRLSTEVINSHPRLFLATLIILIREGRVRDARKRAYSFKVKSREFDSWHGKSIEDDVQVELLVIIDVLLASYSDEAVTRERLSATENIGSRLRGDDKVLLSIVLESAMRQYLEQGEIDEARGLLKELEDLSLEDNTTSFYSYAYTRIDSALINVSQVRLTDAQRNLDEALQIASDHPQLDFNLKPAISVFLGELAYLRNEVSRARELLEQSITHLEKFDAGFVHYLPAFTALAGVAHHTGDRKATKDAFARASRVSERRRLPRLASLMALLEIKFLLMDGRIDDAISKAEELGLEQMCGDGDPDDMAVIVREQAGIVLARLLISVGDPARALDILHTFATKMQAQGRYRWLVEVLLLKARAAYDRGDGRTAENLVIEAAKLSMHEQYRRPFLDEGEAGIGLYESVIASDRLQSSNIFAKRFLMDVVEIIRRETASKQSRSSYFGLTNLEYDVAAKLSDGLSNKMIARDLSISIDTVKYRLKKIYKKLGVANRRDAAKKIFREIDDLAETF